MSTDDSTATRTRREDSPAPADITTLREACGITKAQAARMLRTSWRALQQWETGDREMHPAMWDLARARWLLHAGRDAEALDVLAGAP
jgi:DNA-binding transcriptional regulator YiaG